MACPWFEPLAPVDPAAGPLPARAPLGTLFEGVCCVRGERYNPEPAVVRQSCNFGYGRGVCDRFPRHGDSTDAVRFSLRGNDVVWIEEKNYSPAAHGVSDGALNPVLIRQIEAFRRTCQVPS